MFLSLSSFCVINIFFLFLPGVFFTSLYELCGQTMTSVMFKVSCVNVLSRHSFEGPELLSNKTCSIGKTCGTNLPLLHVPNSLIRWKLIFFLKFSELPSKDLLPTSKALSFKCRLFYSNSCNIEVSQLQHYVAFFSNFIFLKYGIDTKQNFWTSVDS